ncbi:peptide MFS transporter [Sphingomonas sp. SM33]|uniref:Peptide MFS transporter n=1 Tax=Sphingomonas telluris TaxID=2907998 RepID=A0ABS9VKD4_9SPHN|nr:peptide MFS transporter [Sphingomonas telluris]MCH8614959.1 peptide MFS transporter [Sphingomonas telluris]
MVDTPAVEEPFSPASGRTNPAKKETWFGHPRQLARLFTTEMWERFGYYGMRALLTLYLTKHFLFSDQQATGLYGGYTALVYLTPLVGGFIADQYLGSKRSIKFGAILMAIGYFTLAFGGSPAKPIATIDGQRYEVVRDNFVDRPTSDPNEARYIVDNGQKLQIRGNEDGSVSLLNNGQEARNLPKGSVEFGGERNPLTLTIMLIALSLISVGNGFFKPNISTIVGALYEQGDRRRDSGFTIFYMGINLGSIGGQLLCPFLADAFGWWAGLSLAGVGMLISYALIQFDGGRLSGYGERPETGKNRDIVIYVCALLAVPVFVFLFSNLMNATEAEPGSGFLGYLVSLPLMGKLLFGTFLIAVPGILAWSYAKGTKQEAQMMTAAMILIVFNVFFWTLFEQAGSSLTLFADRNTDRSVFGLFSMSAPQTQNFNPISIVLFAPLMSILWGFLAKRGLEPSIPVKFSIALMGVGAGFLFLVLGTQFATAENNWQVGLWWLAGLYLIHSLAELCISPVGLSMITKLSIARVVGLMMGVWFLSISVAQYVAGVVAQFASVETVGGQVTNLKVSLDTYTATFTTIAWIAIGAGVVLFLLSWPLQRWMHGVK